MEIGVGVMRCGNQSLHRSMAVYILFVTFTQFPVVITDRFDTLQIFSQFAIYTLLCWDIIMYSLIVIQGVTCSSVVERHLKVWWISDQPFLELFLVPASAPQRVLHSLWYVLS